MEADNYVAKLKAQDEMFKKGSVDGNAYAASLPDHHLSTKAESWEWRTGAVKKWAREILNYKFWAHKKDPNLRNMMIYLRILWNNLLFKQISVNFLFA